MAKTTVAAVKAEGNFYKEQFACATEEELDALLQERIDEAAAEIRWQVGAENYESTDEDVAAMITTAETYLACAKAYQTIANIVATWDLEELPSEFIHPEAIPGIIERYRRLAEELLKRFDTRADEIVRPYFRARSIDE